MLVLCSKMQLIFFQIKTNLITPNASSAGVVKKFSTFGAALYCGSVFLAIVTFLTHTLHHSLLNCRSLTSHLTLLVIVNDLQKRL